jgi:membrane protein
MRKGLITFWQVVSKSFKSWGDDNAAQLAAAIAYYTIFSLPPLLILALSITGYFFDKDVTRTQLIAQLGGVVGIKTAAFIATLLTNTTQSTTSPIASIIGVGVLLAGASGIYYQMRYALNRVWNVPKKAAQNLLHTVKDQVVSFLIMLAIALVFLVILILSTVLSVIIGKVDGFTHNVVLLEVLNFFVLFITVTILIAVVYRVIPDKEITWRDVWLGAAVTGLLFMLGKYAIGFYLTFSNSGSAYGVAGSLIVLLVWIFYSAQVFLLGAEFTHVYSMKLRAQPKPEIIARG